MHKINCFFSILFFTFYSLIVNAQSETLSIDEEDSIVYISEAPVIINKSITHKQEVYKSWFVEVYGSLFSHENSYCTCEKLISYKTEMKKSNNSGLGNGLGFSIMNVSNKRRLVYSFGIATSSFHENFKQQKDDSSLVVSFKNKYNYLDFSLGLGYWLRRKKEYVSVLIDAKLIGSKLMLSSGNTIDYKDVYKILTNGEANRDASWVLSGLAGIKIIALNNKRIKVFAEPFTRVNFTSVLDYKKHYYQRRWAYGVSIGIIYTI